MDIELVKKFRFEAAHYLPQFPEGHKCRRLHGHSFEVEVRLRGPVNEATGVLVDFGDISRVVKPLIELLDHYCLNEQGAALGDAYLQNPSSENLARWFYFRLQPLLPALYAIAVQETCTAYCVFYGPAGAGAAGAAGAQAQNR